MPVIAPFRGVHARAAPAGGTEPGWPLAPDGAGQAGAATAPAPSLAQLQAWVAQGLWVRDARPGLYHYEVLHGPPEARRRSVGVLCRLALEGALEEAAAGGQVRSGPPNHEADPRDAGHGADGPGAAPGIDLDPVVLRYRDERGWVDEVLASNAFVEVVRGWDADGAEHRVWRVEREEGVGEAVAQFEDRALELAAGASTWAQAVARWASGRREADASVLALLTTVTDPVPWRAGLVVSPRDEPRPRTWRELAGDPGPAQWRTPAF